MSGRLLSSLLLALCAGTAAGAPGTTNFSPTARRGAARLDLSTGF